MSSIYNDNGEPMMTAAALRFEGALDDQAAHEAALDWDEGRYDYEPNEPTYAECVASGTHGDDANGSWDGTWTCAWCGESCPAPVSDWDDPDLIPERDESWDERWPE